MKRAFVSFTACVFAPVAPLFAHTAAAEPAAQDQPTAAEPAATAQAPAAPANEPRPVLALSLDDALRIALEADLGLAIEETVVDVARFDFAGSWGAFDPVWTATGSVSDSEFEA